MNLQNYFSIEMIYLWLNFGVLPLWVALIFFPNSRISMIFISSIFLPIIFSTLYIYIVYKILFLGEDILELINLYSSIDGLYFLFSNFNFLLIFWIHFLGINLFLGSWISRDASKYNVSKILSGISLILIYLAGPLGLVLYWFIRIFYSKKISLHD